MQRQRSKRMILCEVLIIHRRKPTVHFWLVNLRFRPWRQIPFRISALVTGCWFTYCCRFRIPFYNVYCLCKLTWGIGWLFLIIFTPLLFDVFSWVVMVGFMITHWKLAKQFGKSDGFAIGTAVLPLVFLAILAFGNATYKG